MAPSAPIFELARVQYAVPAPLISMAVSSDMLAMGLSGNQVQIVLIELSRPEQVVKLPIQRKPSEFSLHKLFLDPSGRHLIVTSTQGENWYLYKGWKKFKQLKSFKMVIESIAWNKAALLSSANSTSSREFLIGARNGTIYEALLDAEDDFFKSQERYVNPVFSFPERMAITGIQYQVLPPADLRQAVVILTTASRIYQFSGPLDKKADEGSRIFTSLFSRYKDTAPRKFLCTLSIVTNYILFDQVYWNCRETLTSPNFTSSHPMRTRPNPYQSQWHGRMVRISAHILSSTTCS